MMKRSRKRSLVKSLTYRVVCSAETFLVSWIATGSWQEGGLISSILFFTKIGTFFAHERVWEHVHWGKELRERGVPREKILRKLGESHVGDKSTWVGKDYSIADLRKDLGSEDT